MAEVSPKHMVQQRRESFRNFGRTERKEEEKKESRKKISAAELRLAEQLQKKKIEKEIEALRLFPEIEDEPSDEYSIEVDSSTCVTRKQRLVGIHALAAVCGSSIVAVALFLASQDTESSQVRKSEAPLVPILLCVFGAIILVDASRRLHRDRQTGQCPWQEVVTKRVPYLTEMPTGGEELADLISSQHARAWMLDNDAKGLPSVESVIRNTINTKVKRKRSNKKKPKPPPWKDFSRGVSGRESKTTRKTPPLTKKTDRGSRADRSQDTNSSTHTSHEYPGYDKKETRGTNNDNERRAIENIVSKAADSSGSPITSDTSSSNSEDENVTDSLENKASTSKDRIRLKGVPPLSNTLDFAAFKKTRLKA